MFPLSFRFHVLFYCNRRYDALRYIATPRHRHGSTAPWSCSFAPQPLRWVVSRYNKIFSENRRLKVQVLPTMNMDFSHQQLQQGEQANRVQKQWAGNPPTTKSLFTIIVYTEIITMSAAFCFCSKPFAYSSSFFSSFSSSCSA